MVRLAVQQANKRSILGVENPNTVIMGHQPAIKVIVEIGRLWYNTG